MDAAKDFCKLWVIGLSGRDFDNLVLTPFFLVLQ